MTAVIASRSTRRHVACSRARPAGVGGSVSTNGTPLFVLRITSESSGTTPSRGNPSISCTSSADIMSSPLTRSGRTLFTMILMSLMPSHSSSPATRSASRSAVMSGVVTSTASSAGAMAVTNPASTPTRQKPKI
uniref:Uncharacterized protein n=1 Tax=Triticum urartu TaxID=4572 RepID=A0A8R7R5S5_TRIUA